MQIFWFPKLPRLIICLLAAATVLFISGTARAQDKSAQGKALYDQIKSFSLNGGPATVKDLVLDRDRVQMTVTGSFYFTAAVEGRVRGAIFIGQGKFTAAVPPSDFEKQNVKRLLGADVVESDFKTAVLRFSDDTFERLGQTIAPSTKVDPELQKTANEAEARILKQTGANISARVALSILNQEKPGFFFASFEGGRRGRFNFVLDYQNRIPVANFDIDGGEKGLIFTYETEEHDNEIWMAFYSQDDYQKRRVDYSDVNDLIDVSHYDLDVDLREHKKFVRLREQVESETKFAGLRAISFRVGEDLGERESWRLNKQLRLQQARAGGTDLAFAQEDWEGGFTVFLPDSIAAGQKLLFDFILQGDFMYDAESVADCHYPRSNESWFARHRYLDRATFDLTFRHPKKLKIASVGVRLSEDPDAENKNIVVTKYRMDHHVPLVVFALAPFERHSQTVKWEKGGVGE